MNRPSTFVPFFRIHAALACGAALLLGACGGAADTGPDQDLRSAADTLVAPPVAGAPALRPGDLAAGPEHASAASTDGGAPAAPAAAPEAVDAAEVPTTPPAPGADGAADAGQFSLSGYGASAAGDTARQDGQAPAA